MGQVTYEITRLEPLTHSHVASRSGCGREDSLLTLGDGRALCWEGHKGHLMDLRFFRCLYKYDKWMINGGFRSHRGTRNHLKLDQGLKPMVTTGVPL